MLMLLRFLFLQFNLFQNCTTIDDESSNLIPFVVVTAHGKMPVIRYVSLFFLFFSRLETRLDTGHTGNGERFDVCLPLWRQLKKLDACPLNAVNKNWKTNPSCGELFLSPLQSQAQWNLSVVAVHRRRQRTLQGGCLSQMSRRVIKIFRISTPSLCVDIKATTEPRRRGEEIGAMRPDSRDGRGARQ